MTITPNPLAPSLGIATNGDQDRLNTFEITSTVWDHNGILYVEVTDITGQHQSVEDVPRRDIQRARALARRCLMYPERTRCAPLRGSHLNTQHRLVLKFAVSRMDL